MSGCRSKHRSKVRTILWSAMLACSVLHAAPSAAQNRQPETGERVVPVEVTVNGGAGGIWPIVVRDGVLYAPAEAFTSWRLLVRPETPSIDYRGLAYVPIGAITGVESKLDPDKGTLQLTVPGEAFAATRLSRELSPVLPRTAVVPAVFVNYDLNYSRTGGPVPTDGLGLIGEAGASGRWGVLTQTFVAPNLVGQGSQGLTRLETTFRRDFPDQGYTLVGGDSTLRTGLLGRNAYFGGVQFGTNFSLAPYINRQPVPLIAGQTSTPSTVQLYVNDVLRQTNNVPAGPFAVDNMPTLTGNGEVTVRVRDILGRETVITQPFVVTSDLLAPGINDWSVEAGKLRRNLGSASWDYGDPFVSGLLRRGLTNTTTAEGRVEVAKGRSALGLAGVQAIGSDVLVRAGAMASQNDRLGNGSRWLLGLERLAYSGNMSLMAEGNSRAFRSLGEEDIDRPVNLQLAAQGSWSFPWGRVGVALAYQKPFIADPVTTASLNYSIAVGARSQLSVYYTRAITRNEAYTMGALLIVPLDRTTNTATSVQRQGGRDEFYTSATHTPDGPFGVGWRALVAKQGQERAEAGVNWLTPYGVFTAEGSVRPHETDVRLGAVGGGVWTEGQVFAVPRFDTSAAIVSVPGQPRVGVGLGAQETQRTDGKGVTLVSGLTAYEANHVRLNANDLPLSAEVDSLEQEVVPPYRSVAKVEFAVRGGKAALMTITFDDGEPAPAGATVTLDGESKEAMVARRGEAYISGLKDSNRLRLHWQGHECALTLQLPADAPDISRVGPLRCTGVAR
jgi:outer membrane usher protein